MKTQEAIKLLNRELKMHTIKPWGSGYARFNLLLPLETDKGINEGEQATIDALDQAIILLRLSRIEWDGND